jgi:hypothetical protein
LQGLGNIRRVIWVVLIVLRQINPLVNITVLYSLYIVEYKCIL